MISLWFFPYGFLLMALGIWANLEVRTQTRNPRVLGLAERLGFSRPWVFQNPGFEFLVLMIDPLRAHYQFSSSSRISLRVIPTSVNSPYVMQCFEN